MGWAKGHKDGKAKSLNQSVRELLPFGLVRRSSLIGYDIDKHSAKESNYVKGFCRAGEMGKRLSRRIRVLRSVLLEKSETFICYYIELVLLVRQIDLL